MNRRTGALSVISACLLLLASAGMALGYDKPPGTITIRVHAVCTGISTITAIVEDADGNPLAGQDVTWTIEDSPSAVDTIGTSSATNAAGVATTTATLGPETGPRTVRATTGDVSGTAVVDVACGEVLPVTSTASPVGQSGAIPLLLLAVLALSVLGFGLTLRARSTTD